VRSIADAVRLRLQLVPEIGQLDASELEVLDARVPRLGNEPLAFCKSGSGHTGLPLPHGSARSVECRSGGETVGSWELSEHNFRGELVLEVAEPSPDPVELTFVNHELRSPFELGNGDDTRQLGLGVDEVRLVR
jgi:hypothetical protein